MFDTLPVSQAACREGIGSAEFTRIVRIYPDWKACLDGLEKQPVIIDQWQLEKLALVARRAEILWCVPGVPRDDRVAVIPEGPYVFAQVAEVGRTFNLVNRAAVARLPLKKRHQRRDQLVPSVSH